MAFYKMKLLGSWALVGWLLYSPWVSAKNTAPAPVGVLETLLVEASSTAANDTAVGVNLVSLSTKDLLPSARIDSADILQHLPGLQVDSRSNYAQDTRISLRGFGARSAFGVRGIDLQLDGVPLSMPDGQGQLSSVMLDEVAAVELLRGPIAALYGNGGGVVRLSSALPQASQLRLGLTAGDDGLAREYWSGAWRQEGLAAQLALSDMSTDGTRPHAAAERQQLSGQLYYLWDKPEWDNPLELRLSHHASRDPRLEDPLGLTAAQWRQGPQGTAVAAERFDTHKTIEHEQTSLSLRQAQGDSRWQLALWQGQRDIEQYLGFGGETTNGGVVDLAKEFAGFNGNFTQDLQVFSMPATVSVGAEVAQMEDRRRGFVNDVGRKGELRRNERGTVLNRDIYSLLELQATERWRLFGGGRLTYVELEVDDFYLQAPSNNDPLGNPDDSGARNFDEEAWALGTSYRLPADGFADLSDWQLFASGGRGYETPTLTEMAYRAAATPAGSSGASADLSGGLNLDLAATQNRQYEWGLRYQSSGVALRGDERLSEFSLTQFRVESRAEIVVDQSNNGRTTYSNAAATRRQGVEVNAYQQLNAYWQWRLTAQYLTAIYHEGEWQGQQMPGVARANSQLQLDYRPLGDARLALGFALQARTKVATSDDNQIYAPAYERFDAVMQGEQSWAAWRLEWWLRLNNLTDENYVGAVIVNQTNGRAFEPAPGRSLAGSLQLAYVFD